MRYPRPLPLILLGALCGCAFAQAKYIPAPQRKGYAELDEANLRGDLEFLASDKLQGRMSLQPGDEEAIQWIAGQFGKIGLDPAAVGASTLPSYLQTFELVEYRPDRAATTVTLTRDGKTTVWHAPEAFGAYKHAVDLTAPVVFAGYGITAHELNYDDYTGIDAKGKIVFVFDHEPQEDDPQSIFNGTGNTRYATTRVKLLNAQAHGAVALVLVAEPNRKHPTNAERAARIGGSSVRTEPLPLQALVQDELHIPAVVVNDEVAKAILATSPMSGSEMQSALDRDLMPQGRQLTDTTLTLHLVNQSERVASTSNVAGLLKGADSQLSPETIIISAHHDHDGATPCPKDQGGVDETGKTVPPGPGCLEIWHGADDNGSGTVGVIELARAFVDNKTRPPRSILFVVFASEERGLLGSFYMAAHPLRPLATTRAMINFDMIGRDEKPSPQTDGLIQIPPDTSNRLNLIGVPYSPDYDAVVREENQLINLTLDYRFDHDAVLNVLFRSDQFPFLLHNVPAMWWFTGFHPDYHHVTDTVEKIDFVKMRKILQLAYLSAWRFAEGTPPVFVANPAPPHTEAPSTEPGAPGPPHPGVVPVTLIDSVAPAADTPPRTVEKVSMTPGTASSGPEVLPPGVTKVSLKPLPDPDAPKPPPMKVPDRVKIDPVTMEPVVINPSTPPPADSSAPSDAPKEKP